MGDSHDLAFLAVVTMFGVSFTSVKNKMGPGLDPEALLIFQMTSWSRLHISQLSVICSSKKCLK